MTTHWTDARWIIQSVINKLMYAPWHQKSVILATRKIRNKETTASFIFSFYLYCHIFVCTIHFALFLFHSTLKTKSLDQSSFQLTYDKPKPKQSQRPIITKINTIISQLKLKVITGKLPKGRENTVDETRLTYTFRLIGSEDGTYVLDQLRRRWLLTVNWKFPQTDLLLSNK